MANLTSTAKMTILPQSPTRQSTNQCRGPIEVGECGEFDQCGENDNFATIANEAKHIEIRGPIKVGDCGEFGKYGETDNFSTIANKAKHKAMKGADTSWRMWRTQINERRIRSPVLFRRLTSN